MGSTERYPWHLSKVGRISTTIIRDSWTYPYQCTPMGNPYKSPIIVGISGEKIPKNPIREHQLNTMGTPLGVDPSLPL